MKVFRKIKEFKKNNDGTTLVEMMVAFVLIGLFVVAAARIISSSSLIYYNVKGVSYGEQVTEIIENKVVGAVEGARCEKIGGTDYYILITDEGSSIRLRDNTGSDITIFVDNDGLLDIKYAEVEAPNSETPVYKEVDWKFDKNMYMGYSIKGLKFSHQKDNILLMELTISSPKYGTYTSQQYIECYNISIDDSNKIFVEE